LKLQALQAGHGLVWAVWAGQGLVLQAVQAYQGLPPTRAVLQLATVGVVLTQTAKLPPAVTVM